MTELSLKFGDEEMNVTQLPGSRYQVEVKQRAMPSSEPKESVVTEDARGVIVSMVMIIKDAMGLCCADESCMDRARWKVQMHWEDGPEDRNMCELHAQVAARVLPLIGNDVALTPRHSPADLS